MAKGVALTQKADRAGLLADLTATIDAVIHAGAVGMVGYCWGGAVTYIAGCRTNIAAAVVLLRRRHRAACSNEMPRCPMHVSLRRAGHAHPARATSNACVPPSRRARYHLYAADHGFNCTDRASFDAAAAHLAFERTLEFFRKYLG